jgi:alkanesulfonate monooxygenase SsuD/methylene tetrahydromethanopterin reductase-like flavin-dependent oxidoreductase (luciferase family)
VGPDDVYRELIDKRMVIGGSAATVRDQLKELVSELRIGNLLLMVQMGSMPHELVLKNIDLLAREVLPEIRGMWEDDWEHEWWPEPLRTAQTAPQAAVVGAA